jgi:uncharacterized protein with HEPN domain
MPPDEHDLKLLWDMLRAAEDAAEITAAVSRDEYMKSKLMRLACERLIEIMGEAARGVSAEGRMALAQVEWRAIIATRNIIAHDYDEVDHEKLWRIVTLHAPALIAAIRPVLDASPPGPEASKDLGEP